MKRILLVALMVTTMGCTTAQKPVTVDNSTALEMDVNLTDGDVASGQNQRSMRIGAILSGVTGQELLAEDYRLHLKGGATGTYLAHTRARNFNGDLIAKFVLLLEAAEVNDEGYNTMVNTMETSIKLFKKTNGEGILNEENIALLFQEAERVKLAATTRATTTAQSPAPAAPAPPTSTPQQTENLDIMEAMAIDTQAIGNRVTLLEEQVSALQAENQKLRAEVADLERRVAANATAPATPPVATPPPAPKVPDACINPQSTLERINCARQRR